MLNTEYQAIASDQATIQIKPEKKVKNTKENGCLNKDLVLIPLITWGKKAIVDRIGAIFAATSPVMITEPLLIS